ncbi:hypothetical protein DEU56DRAFT_831120 [Suillus clintonianus]|uniref:uncharacterized protein n=1 Tax=Suillus clintonianus TaxID=1904413 RepID=UPI001B87F847|nr:uncharacterized protein DEU56DRAFT_831120 [Suillus clintonianus]KAG2122929.1 hypothetical protein DEU56DRAFT_831120 [Suillus clintonianus]
MMVAWVLTVVVDSAIAFTLCLYLRRRRTGMKMTDSVINRLLLYTVNTGAITSLFAILVLIMVSECLGGWFSQLTLISFLVYPLIWHSLLLSKSRANSMPYH